jgi:tripartite-type tricarboxylate transporter receptor subunit TctC
MKHTRRSALSMGLALAASTAWGQSPFGKPITIVVPYPPGGNADIVARAIAGPVAKIIGQSVMIDNRGGGGGVIGASLVAKSPADGTTLLACPPGVLGTSPHLLKTPYKMQDFVPVGVVSKTSIALIVRKSETRFKTVEDLITFARANPERINVGHAGPGTPNHLALLQFEDTAKCKFTAVSYKGMAPALVDLLAGNIDVTFDQIASSMPHLKAGTLNALLVLGPTRDAAIPEARTLKEAGLAEFDMSTYLSVYAPKGVPESVLATLTAALQKVASDPAYDRGLKEMGSSAYYGDPARTAAILKADEDLAIKLVRQGRLIND